MKRIILTLTFSALLLAGIPNPTNAQNRSDMKKETQFRQIFPQGDENPPANAQYFIGQSYLAPLTHNKALNCPVYNVTFEPGCRNTGTATRAARY